MIKMVIIKIASLKNSIRIIFKDLFLNSISANVCCPIPIRLMIYRIYKNEIGVNCYFSPRCFLGYGKGHLHLGENVFVNYNCWFDLGDDIYIGDNCSIAMNVAFINGTHEIGDSIKRAGKGITKPIIIGRGSWVGGNSVIMPGVNIGEGCIIGAGSLVLEDCEPDSIYVGRPAKLLRKLPK